MIPKLFSAAETAFTSEGLGRLSDAKSCTVTEVRNGKYELEMDYPVDGIHFSEIAHSCYIYAKPADNKDPQPFPVYSISKPIGGICTIRAEHISYRLINVPVTPCSASTCVNALQVLKNNAVESCPFTFWTDKTSSGTFKVIEPASLRSRLAGSEGSILDAFGGGEYEWDGMTVKLYAQRGANNGVTLRYGKNIVDIKQEENIQNTFTGVMPYWKKEEQDGTTTIVMLDERVVYSSNASNFPFNRTKILDCSQKWETEPTQAQLRTYATNYVQDTGVGVPEVSITVKFLPLWQSEEYKNIANLEHVNLCDTVTVKFEKLGISASSKVIRTKYDTLMERYEEIELGDAKRSLSTSIRSDIDAARDESSQKISEAKSFLREEMEDAISQIQLGDDGYIVFNYNNNNQRTQILAMDTMDVQTARKILMINYQGIGGFTNGISDSSGYKLAITTDGNIVAESIAAGTIKAALMLGNTLTLGGSGVGGSGAIIIKNSSNQTIGQWDKDGITVTTGEISCNAIKGGTLLLGGANNNENGKITIKDELGETCGTWTSTGIHIMAGTISGATLTAGGSKDGVITVQNSSGTEIGRWDKDGIVVKSGTINGPLIIVGGNNNEHGRFYVRDANDQNVVIMAQSGITVNKGIIQGPTIIAGGANNANGTITVKDAEGNNVVRMNNEGASIIGSIESKNPNGLINGYTYHTYCKIDSATITGGSRNVQSGAPITSGSCGTISFTPRAGDNNYRGILINPSQALEIQTNRLFLTIGSGNSYTQYSGQSTTINYITPSNVSRKATFKLGILVSDETV